MTSDELNEFLDKMAADIESIRIARSLSQSAGTWLDAILETAADRVRDIREPEQERRDESTTGDVD